VGALYSTSPWFQRLKLKPLMSNYRFVIYYTSFEIFKDYPIIGVGFGMKTFEKHMWHQYNPKVPRKWQVKEPAQTPHSFFFSILVRLGIVGTAIFGFILVKIFHMNMILLQYKKEEVRNWGAYLLVSFIGMLISGLFGSILHGAAAYNVYIVLAMITVVWQSTQNPRNHSLHYSRKDILARP
jgi:O-antigen ligase